MVVLYFMNYELEIDKMLSNIISLEFEAKTFGCFENVGYSKNQK